MDLKIHDQELILQDLWKSRKLFTAPLTTFTGKSVEILYAGTLNYDAGPDFKGAVIKINETLLEGDVEVHLGTSGWIDHKHHTDPAYNEVVLHVVSAYKSGPECIQREDGVFVEQVQVTLDQETVTAWKLQKKMSGNVETEIRLVEQCPLSESSVEKMIAVVDAAGELRFLDKVAQLQEQLLLDSWNQVTYKKILEALGYSKNQKPFHKLAELVTFDMLSSEMQWVKEDMAEMRCTALLFGAAGLLPVTHRGREEMDAQSLRYVTPILDLWDGISRRLEIKPMKMQEWQFFRLRPQNFPTRRLAGFVRLMMRVYKHGLLEALLRVVNGNINDLKKLSSELEQSLTQKADGFWKNRYRIEKTGAETTGKQEPLLIGRERARDIIVNILLPAFYLYGDDSSAGQFKNTAIELYRRQTKLSGNVITKTMCRQLGGSRGAGFQTKFASQQQGLLHLNKLYCRNLNCDACLRLGEG